MYRYYFELVEIIPTLALPPAPVHHLQAPPSIPFQCFYCQSQQKYLDNDVTSQWALSCRYSSVSFHTHTHTHTNTRTHTHTHTHTHTCTHTFLVLLLTKISLPFGTEDRTCEAASIASLAHPSGWNRRSGLCASWPGTPELRSRHRHLSKHVSPFMRELGSSCYYAVMWKS